MKRLNIGAGSKRRDGFLSVDVRGVPEVDIVSTAWDLDDDEASSIGEIYTRHMLEHLDPNDGRKSIRRWFEILAPGGRVNIVVPDLEFHARQLLGAAKSHFDDQMAHAYAGFFGWRDEGRGGNREDAHRWGYTEHTLAALLIEYGFISVARQLSGPDSEPWHLNMVAVKPGQAPELTPELAHPLL
jgi:hypothetical protein